MDITYRIGNQDDAFMIRRKVFIEEQGFSNEFDTIDTIKAHHITVYTKGVCVGCSRIFPDDESANTFIFGRLAVIPEYRKRGIGGAILAFSEETARRAGANCMKLHAQCRVTSFYEKLGYQAFGLVELDEHVEHIWMKKQL